MATIIEHLSRDVKATYRSKSLVSHAASHLCLAMKQSLSRATYSSGDGCLFHTGLPPAELLPDAAGFERLWHLHPPAPHRMKMFGRPVRTPRWQQRHRDGPGGRFQSAALSRTGAAVGPGRRRDSGEQQLRPGPGIRQRQATRRQDPSPETRGFGRRTIRC